MYELKTKLENIVVLCTKARGKICGLYNIIFFFSEKFETLINSIDLQKMNFLKHFLSKSFLFYKISNYLIISSVHDVKVILQSNSTPIH